MADDPLKIYTKTGDQGQTSLIGGMRVPKDHPRIEAYGTLDELNSFLGLARDHLHDQQLTAEIISVQENIFTIESLLAASTEESASYLPQIDVNSILTLEASIDRMDAEMPPLQNFILPGGNIAGSYFHVARCVCRRAERLVISLSHDELVDELILRYLNRLSDFLFVCARFVAFKSGSTTVDWNPNR